MDVTLPLRDPGSVHARTCVTAWCRSIRTQRLQLMLLHKSAAPTHANSARDNASRAEKWIGATAIAPALCMPPRNLLLDESTSALDSEMITEVLEVLVDLAQEGVRCSCVSHEMGLAREKADRIIY